MNKKGVTLVMLTITIVVILILTTIVVKKSDNLNEDAKALELFNNMVQIKSKVDIETYNIEDFELANPTGNYQYKGELVSDNETIGEVTYPILGEEEQWYRFTSDNVTYPSGVSLEQIGIYNIEGTYLVNYVTGQIVSKEGILVDEVMYHTLESLSSLYDFDV